VEHIRTRGFRPPYVGELLRATAEAEVLGKPYPAQTAADVPDDSVLAKIDRTGEPGADLRASDALTVMHHRFAEYGIARSAYRIGETADPVDGAWWLRNTDQGWEVLRPPMDDPVRFAHLEEAARFLLGTLLLYPARAGEEQETRESAVDWPIVPLRGEPPLNFYRGKRIVELPAGTTLPVRQRSRQPRAPAVDAVLRDFAGVRTRT
jgi:hypothetical protein